ncbi:hypothetical protein BH09BAC1_BH09BAC1_11280 [soil metagenome]
MSDHNTLIMRYNYTFILPFLLLFGLMAISNTSTAQAYKNAIGFRVGSPFGLTWKHLFSEKHGFEGIVGTRGRSIEVIGMYEYHIYPAKKAPEFDLYFGGGAHLGFYGGYDPYYYGPGPKKGKDKFWKNRPYWASEDPYLGVGLDAIVGCSYTFKKAPINLGIDYKPAVSLLHYYGFLHADAAISVRFTL